MSGIKHDKGKPQLSLIDPLFSEEVARVLEFGKDRYGLMNWAKGLSYLRVVDAIKRHIAAFETGQDDDPETGMPHMAHMASCAMFLCHYLRNKRADLDDRLFKIPPVPSVQKGTRRFTVSTLSGDEVRLDLPEVLEEPVSFAESNINHPSADPDPIRGLQKRIASWADVVFPSRTPHNALKKMLDEEVPELVAAYGKGLIDPEELADVFILTIDVAYLIGIDIVEAAHRKMAKNEKRKWALDPKTGLMHHVEEKQ